MLGEDLLNVEGQTSFWRSFVFSLQKSNMCVRKGKDGMEKRMKSIDRSQPPPASGDKHESVQRKHHGERKEDFFETRARKKGGGGSAGTGGSAEDERKKKKPKKRAHVEGRAGVAVAGPN